MRFKPFSETKYYWIAIILLTIIAILFKSIYRQYIYSNDINDYGIADSSPNFFAGIIILLFSNTQRTKSNLKTQSFYVLVGLIGYELIQGNIFKHNHFDYKDIFASILGVLIGYIFISKPKQIF